MPWARRGRPAGLERRAPRPRSAGARGAARGSGRRVPRAQSGAAPAPEPPPQSPRARPAGGGEPQGRAGEPRASSVGALPGRGAWEWRGTRNRGARAGPPSPPRRSALPASSQPGLPLPEPPGRAANGKPETPGAPRLPSPSAGSAPASARVRLLQAPGTSTPLPPAGPEGASHVLGFVRTSFPPGLFPRKSGLRGALKEQRMKSCVPFRKDPGKNGEQLPEDNRSMHNKE
ncbi:basic proline-rich protein-like [Rhinolophus ferrumequinum]|uniref:basic proline-rich protein-like n=1 Tax=Rhinolophus ferrumequinum TaxID=59479 RepID=UPI00140F501A|nr:basic proline-rich protein-like [Rhinolophus ferrumequinum]